jgi:hypothetical protein
VKIRSFLGEQSGDSIAYNFTGKVSGDEMGEPRHGRTPGRQVDGQAARDEEGLR